MPKGRKDEMPTYTGLGGEKVAIKRGSSADKKRIKEKQKTYSSLERTGKATGKDKTRFYDSAQKETSSVIGATLAGYSAERKASKLEKKFK